MPSETAITGQAKAVLLLLLTGVICNAVVIPYISVYIVEGLGKEPWLISIYAMTTLFLTLIVNRQYGEWIDAGKPIAPMIAASILAFALAMASILTFDNFWVLVCFASPCFAISNASVSTMYSFGRMLAERQNLNIARYNSYLRAMTSLGWMIAPALSFYIASIASSDAVFALGLLLCGVWFVLWWVVMPKGFAVDKPAVSASTEPLPRNTNLWLATAVCLAFALAHSMSMSALPLFYIREAGLPAYAPGISLSVKTAVEIVAILLAPFVTTQLGARNALRCAAVLAVVAFFILARVTTLPMLVVGAALEGLYYGLFAAVGLTYVQDFAEGKLARATSLYMNSLFLGGLIASPLMGLTAQFVSFGMAIKLSTLWAVLAFALLTYTGIRTAASRGSDAIKSE
ncbi:MAG: MFS transporter [Yoonia sp.]|nr:MFS transporter [Yoonia sp.]